MKLNSGLTETKVQSTAPRCEASKYRVQSRYPKWAKWRNVYPSIQGEMRQFDDKGLLFTSEAEATQAIERMKKWNAGEFRVIESKP